MLKNLHHYLKNIKDPMSNFNLGLEYESMGQISSALGMYLRTANITNDNELAYVCLLKMGAIFIKLENRPFSTETTFQQAVALLPKRPEAYFLLSQHQERIGKNLESYLTASIALESCDFNLSPLKVDVGYVGKWGIIFEKAVTSWHCGKEDQARALFQTLIDIYWDQMDFSHRASVENNAIRLGCLPVHKTHKHYNKKYHSRLKFQFPGSDQIDRNFAQVYQDLFVLYLLKGKRNGCFLEVGGAKPFEGNNSALLETGFNWCGVSIEYDKNFADNYANERKQTTVLCTDALKINYDELIKNYYASPVIDYLQLDIEPAASTYEALLKIPFNKYKFAVITYEHDYYADVTRSYREKSRKYLTSMGYELVIGNVSPMENCSFEDWWVHPDLVDRKLIDQIKNANSNEVLIEEHFFENHPIIKKKELDWGMISDNKWFRETCYTEIFVDDCYQKFFKVDTGDIVLDVGASIGPFSWNIIDTKPSHIYCVEAHPDLYKTLVSNLAGADVPVTTINKGLGPKDGKNYLSGLFDPNKQLHSDGTDGYEMETISFKTLVKQYNIPQIDFLKTDCEGGEYDIFNADNFNWITKNVKKIAGEFHTATPLQKEKWCAFRDLYLKHFENFQILSLDYIDIKWDIWNDHFLEHYTAFMVFVDNREPNEKNKEDTFDWGLFGKNKWLFNSIEKEFGDDTNYEKFFKVEKNDIVVDIGASVGPFTHSILGSNPTSVFCLEPHSELFKTLSLNLSKYSNIKLINKGISNVDGTVIFNGLFNDSVGSDYIGNDLWKKSEAALGITFDTFLKENNIQKINFLKIDCEGGEYEVFNETNFDWIKNNIDKIAGEWHLGDEILKNKFKKFRDLYLRTFKNHKVFFVDYHSNFFDVTNEIWSDNFVNECGWVNIYIDNRPITL